MVAVRLSVIVMILFPNNAGDHHGTCTSMGIIIIVCTDTILYHVVSIPEQPFGTVKIVTVSSSFGSCISRYVHLSHFNKTLKGKGKGKCIYIAHFLQYLTLKALRHGSHSVICNYTNACLYITYLLTSISASFREEKLRAQENLNPCHQMHFLGSKYVQIAFTVGDSWIKGAYFQSLGGLRPPPSQIPGSAPGT